MTTRPKPPARAPKPARLPAAALVEAFVLERLRTHYRAVRGVPPPPAYLAANRANLRARLAIPGGYAAFSLRGGAVDAFLHAFPDEHSGMRFTVVQPWLGTPADFTAERIEADLAAVRASVVGRKRIMVAALFPDQTVLRERLRTHGLTLDSYELIGRVAEGRAYTARRLKTVDRSGYELTPFAFEADIAAALRLGRLAHEAEPTSRAHGRPPRAERAEMRAFLQTASTGRNRTIALRRGTALVGLVAVTLHPRHRDSALLGSITIHPEHQGKGLANWLYHAALGTMQDAGARWYQGFSSTGKVLRHAASMGRRVNTVLLTDAPWAKDKDA